MPKGSSRKNGAHAASDDFNDEVDDYIGKSSSKTAFSKKDSKKSLNGASKTKDIMDLEMSDDDSEADYGMMGSGSDMEEKSGDSSSQSSEDEFDDKNWGRRKASYYQKDEESDKEGSDEEALAEEAEARRLQKAKAAARREEDFDDSFATRKSKKGAAASDSTESGKDKKSSKSGKGSGARGGQLTSTDAGLLETMYKEMGQFETSLFSGEGRLMEEDGESASRSKMLSQLTRQEKLDLITKDSPELLLLLDSFNAKMKEIREKLAPLIQRARNQQIPTSKGLSYLETKYHLLLNYCTNICFYLLLKAEGKSVKNHPVIEHLARTRTVIDRLKPLDQKLKYQIDKLLKLAAQGEANMQADPKLRQRANIKGFMPVGREADEMDGSEGSDDDEMGENGMDVDEDGGKAEKYVAPKFTTVASERDEKRRQRAEKKAKSGAMAEYLIDEFGDRPLEHVLTSGPRDKSLREAQAERERYEEDNFVRLGLTKKEKKATRVAAASQFVDEFADFADFGDLKALDRADTLHMADDLESKALTSSKKRKQSSLDDADDGESSLVKKAKSISKKDSSSSARIASIMDSIDRRAEASAAAKAHRPGIDEDIDYQAIADEKRAKRRKLKDDADRAEAQHAIDAERRAQDKRAAAEAAAATKGKTKQEKRVTYSDLADAMSDDDEFYKEAVAAQKAAKEEKHAASRAARSERKREREENEPQFQDQDDEPMGDGKRKVSKQIEENRGLRKHKKRELKNSRVKIKDRYEKALKKLRSRGATAEASASKQFGGSSAGINRRVVHSTQL